MCSTACTVTGGSDVTIPAASTVTFAYSCALAVTTTPVGLDNLAAAAWPTQTLGAPYTSALIAGEADCEFDDIAFTLKDTSDDCVAVTDQFELGAPDVLGKVCIKD